MDLNQKVPDSNLTSEAATVQKKTCAACQTTKTPLWRSGPAGPRSLCNACGIRNRKQRRALLGLPKGGSEKMKKKKSLSRSNSSSSSSNSNEMGASLNLDRSELQRSMGRKLMEEEEAAMLLMALSCGSVFA